MVTPNFLFGYQEYLLRSTFLQIVFNVHLLTMIWPKKDFFEPQNVFLT